MRRSMVVHGAVNTFQNDKDALKIRKEEDIRGNDDGGNYSPVRGSDNFFFSMINYCRRVSWTECMRAHPNESSVHFV